MLLVRQVSSSVRHQNKEMETSLKKILKISKIKEQENWEYRAFLKGYDISCEELDSIVQELFSTVCAEVDCTACGSCCKKVSPVLNENDIHRLSLNLGISVEQFQDQYLRKDEDEKYVFNKLPCPFLENNICTQYEYRPTDCRSYPHLHKEDFVFRLIGVIENYSICPIVFNVYELLKEKIRYETAHDYFDE